LTAARPELQSPHQPELMPNTLPGAYLALLLSLAASVALWHLIDRASPTGAPETLNVTMSAAASLNAGNSWERKPRFRYFWRSRPSARH
jgi:hypothetical protein